MNTSRRWYLKNATGSQIVQPCQSVASQAEKITQYIKEGLHNDEAVIVIAKPAVRKAVIFKLNELGFDVQAIKNQSQIKFFDAEFLLLGFMNEGLLEEQAFQEFVGTPIQNAQLKFGKVRVSSEMVDMLWKDGKHDAALQLENLWGNLSAKLEFSLLVTYTPQGIDSKIYEEALEKICEYHSDLMPVEDQNSIEAALDEAMQDFEAAWNRVISKLAESSRFSMSGGPIVL